VAIQSDTAAVLHDFSDPQDTPQLFEMRLTSPVYAQRTGGYRAPQSTKLPSVTKYGKKDHGHPIRAI
jgi:hypothetical protein